MPQILQTAAVALATLGTGAATVTLMNRDVPDLAVPGGAWADGSELDGLSFHVRGTDLEGGRVLEDELIFRTGTFQSANCQIYCDFGWSEYKTKVQGDVIHFTARTECPDAPHTVMWYGTIAYGRVQVEGTWTTRRWYWTRQMRFALSDPKTAAADDLSG